MRLIRILTHRLRSLLTRRGADAGLALEIDLHVEQLIREKMAEGMDESSARSAALREFGSTALIAERCRDQRRVALLEDLARDGAQAVRALAKAPMFAIAAVLTVALGIGVNTAVFSVVHAVLLDPLPYREPERLVHVSSVHPEIASFQVAAPDFRDWQSMSASFEKLCAFTFRAMNKWTIVGDGEPETVQVVQASPELFGMLGIEPILGRMYTIEEERSGAAVVVIGESLWRRKYGADPKILGRSIRLVTWPVTVIGVASQRSAQPAWGDVWMSLAFLDVALKETRKHRALEVIGRLKPGVPLERAQRELSAIAANLERAHPATNARVGVSVTPMSLWIAGDARPALLIAWAAAGLVLLLACANVAHLVLVRTVHRSRELAVRAALGASSPRLVRLLLVENLAVAAAGCALGAVLARVALPALLGAAASSIPRLESLTPSPAAFFFGAAAAAVCALIFAAPALFQMRALPVLPLIRQGSGVSFRSGRSRLGPAIVVAEVALAFSVLSGAGLLYRSFSLLKNEATGFDARGVLAVDVPLGHDRDRAPRVYKERVARELRAIAGVTELGAANVAPMTLRPTESTRFVSQFGVAGRSLGGEFPIAQMRWVTPEYFSVLRIPLIAGRLLDERDDGKRVFVVNETLARRFYPGGAVGQRILTNVTQPNPDVGEIVGVVGDVRDLALDAEPAPALYSPIISNRMTVFLRTRGDPKALAPELRRILHRINPDAPAAMLGTLDEVVERSVAMRRFTLDLIGVFALLAVALTAVGVYGIVSYSLSQRTGEFAVRYALGALPVQIYGVMFRGVAVPLGIGLALGAWMAFLSSRLLVTQLYRLSAHDPVTLAGSAAGLVLLVLVAAMRPASRAARVLPASLLRE